MNNSEAKRLFDEAFNRPRDPRSEEYKAGAMASLKYRCGEGGILCPYGIGTAQADAYFAGVKEGHEIWRRAQEQNKQEVR